MLKKELNKKVTSPNSAKIVNSGSTMKTDF